MVFLEKLIVTELIKK